MGTVFINYRRSDTAGEARALYRDLTTRFGEESVFMDVDDIALGRDFRQALHERLAQCDLMLVLIGREWIDAKNGSGSRRLEDASDFVGLEIEAALKRNIAVTPVLVQGAQMPTLDQLPANLKDFAYRNGFELSHSRWESDVEEMFKRLQLSREATPRVDIEHSADHPGHAHPGQLHPGHSHDAVPVATQRIGKRAIAIAAGALAAVVIAGGATLYFQNSANENARLAAEAKRATTKAEADRVQAELVAARVEREKADAAQAERERTAAAQAEQQQLATAKAKADADASQVAAKAEADRVQAEARASAAKARAERERIAQAERERVAQAARDKTAQAERDRLAGAALAERERELVALRAENDRIAQAARVERDRAAADQLQRAAMTATLQFGRDRVPTPRVDEAAAQRARWKAGYFPAPNAGMTLFAMTSSGDPACASYGGGCLWGMSHEQVDFSKLKPLVCGSAHKARWGATGYEDPKHWCSLAKSGKTAKY